MHSGGVFPSKPSLPEVAAKPTEESFAVVLARGTALPGGFGGTEELGLLL